MDNQANAQQISSPTKALAEIVKRLGALVDEETSALKANNTERLEHFSEQKNRTLLEFNRALVKVENISGVPGLLKDVETLRSRLAENKAVLKRQLSAVKEFSVFLEGEARRHETDGTYSKSIGHYGSQR